jgi:DNA-binding response OmpR family regulator
MARAFHQGGWNTITAGDGLIAQSVVRKEIPDIIVLSSSLPGGGALFAIKRIRSSAHTVATPVVVIARLQGIRGQEFLHAGASAFTENPRDIAGLCDAIAKLLSSDTPVPETPQLAPQEIFVRSRHAARQTAG